MVNKMIKQLPQWIVDIIDESGESTHKILVGQMKINPDAIEALYGE